MGVTVECREGDPIVIISGFYECELGTPMNLEKARIFDIGDVVYYIDDYIDNNARQYYLAHILRFRTEEGKIFEATPIHFVTLEEWNYIEDYFKKKFGI